MECAGRRAGGDAELVTEAPAELVVSVEGFGQVVLGGQRLHQVAVAALP